MLTFLDTADDVIAAVISDAITGADLDGMMDRLEAGMSRHDRVHMFVETRNIQALDVAALPAHVTRAMPLFGKLRRFGRVAVVADQAWMRVGTRIESALLPNIAYRTFRPGHRAEALAWVTGDDAHAASAQPRSSAQPDL